jgi:hypothetical protein
LGWAWPNLDIAGIAERAYELSMTVSISLSSDEALVLFEWLSERESSVRLFDENDRPICAEEFVLNRILGQLEKSLGEPFDPNFLPLLAAARQRILDRA